MKAIIFVLIMFRVDMGIYSQEFISEESCLNAKAQIEAMNKKLFVLPNVLCVPK